MLSEQLEKLWEMASDAHAAIQRDFEEIDPIIGVSQNMRKQGIPADAMTVDCLRSRKRIIIILHDQQPDLVNYQFSFMDKDPEGAFQTIAFSELNTQLLYDWIAGYFSKNSS